jgi:hypothetical protein
MISGSFKRLQVIDKVSFKMRSEEDFTWMQPPQKGALNMITQEIYDYLVASANSSQSSFAELKGLVYQNGVMV